MGNKANIKASERQSIVDLAVQELGSTEAAFLFALENDLPLSDDTVPGQEFSLSDVKEKTLVNYYSQKNVKPATGLSDTEDNTSQENEGVGYWYIGNDFIVS